MNNALVNESYACTCSTTTQGLSIAPPVGFNSICKAQKIVEGMADGNCISFYHPMASLTYYTRRAC